MALGLLCILILCFLNAQCDSHESIVIKTLNRSFIMQNFIKLKQIYPVIMTRIQNNFPKAIRITCPWFDVLPETPDTVLVPNYIHYPIGRG